jgi:hypothetical protein
VRQEKVAALLLLVLMVSKSPVQLVAQMIGNESSVEMPNEYIFFFIVSKNYPIS